MLTGFSNDIQYAAVNGTAVRSGQNSIPIGNKLQKQQHENIKHILGKCALEDGVSSADFALREHALSG